MKDEFEIWGQRLNAATGAAVGVDDFRISDSGPDGNYSFGVSAPDVVYNPAAGEYLAVWSGDDDVTEEVEIYGQRLIWSTGAEVGTNDFRITHVGPDGNPSYEARLPALGYDTADNQYLVVSEGHVFTDQEIFGQRLNGVGAEIGADDFQISDLGPPSDTQYEAQSPAVVYHGASNEYLVLWGGNDLVGGPRAPWTKLTRRPIPAAAGARPGGAVYRLLDRSPVRTRRIYRIDAIELDGRRTTVATVRLGSQRAPG